MHTDHCMQLGVNVIKMELLAPSFANVKTVTILMVEPMIFRFHRKPKQNLGVEAELPVRT